MMTSPDYAIEDHVNLAAAAAPAPTSLRVSRVGREDLAGHVGVRRVDDDPHS